MRTEEAEETKGARKHRVFVVLGSKKRRMGLQPFPVDSAAILSGSYYACRPPSTTYHALRTVVIRHSGRGRHAAPEIRNLNTRG